MDIKEIQFGNYNYTIRIDSNIPEDEIRITNTAGEHIIIGNVGEVENVPKEDDDPISTTLRGLESMLIPKDNPTHTRTGEADRLYVTVDDLRQEFRDIHAKIEKLASAMESVYENAGGFFHWPYKRKDVDW